MANCALTLDILDPNGDPVANGAIGVAPAVAADVPGGGVMVAAEEFYELSDPFNVENFVRGVMYRWREYKPQGRTFYAVVPNTATANYSDLAPLTPSPPAPPMTYTQAEIDDMFADVIADVDTKEDAATLVGQDIRVDGDSLTDVAVMVPGQTPTAAGMYYNRTATRYGANAPVSYGKGGMRINYGVNCVLAAGGFPGLTAPPAGAVWDAGEADQVFVDFLMNDIAHTNGVSITPQPITGAGGARYVAAIAAAYEAYFAIVSSASRKEISSGVSGVTLTGAGAASYAANYLSGGDFTWLTQSGDRADITGITPPQTGPYAGKVYVGIDSFDPAVLPNANGNFSVDGGTADLWTNPQWEAYGTAGAMNQAYAVACVPIPADTANHSIRAAWSGSAGQYLGLDAVFIPSTNPPVIYVMDTYDPTPKAGAYSAADVAVWKANRDILVPAIKAAVAKFPNVVWVPCTMPSGTQWVDGIHPDDEGLLHRSEDLNRAVALVQLIGIAAAKKLLGGYDRYKADLVSGIVPLSQLPATMPSTWTDVSGKPSTFPPTTGSTSTTALAGNSSLFYIPRWKTGDYYESQMVGFNIANFTMTAGTVYYVPIVIPPGSAFTEIGINVATAAAGSALHFGIWSASNGQPNALIQNFGNVASTTTGAKSITGITLSGTVTGGLYWLGIMALGGTPQVSAHALVAGMPAYIGAGSIGETQRGGWDQTGQASLPATATSLARTTNARPRIQVKAA